MTNSHSKPTAKSFNNKSFNGNVSIGSNSGGGLVQNRHYSNTSPNNKKNNSSFFANNSFNNSSSNNNRGLQTKSPRTVLATSNPINIIQQTPNKYNNNNNFNNNCISPNSRSQRSSPPMMSFGSPRMGSCSPPNPSFFAGSKCFDAPKADQLPKPPMHWTFGAFGAKSCASELAASNSVQQKIHMIPMQA